MLESYFYNPYNATNNPLGPSGLYYDTYREWKKLLRKGGLIAPKQGKDSQNINGNIFNNSGVL